MEVKDIVFEDHDKIYRFERAHLMIITRKWNDEKYQILFVECHTSLARTKDISVLYS